MARTEVIAMARDVACTIDELEKLTFTVEEKPCA